MEPAVRYAVAAAVAILFYCLGVAAIKFAESALQKYNSFVNPPAFGDYWPVIAISAVAVFGIMISTLPEDSKESRDGDA